MSDRRKRLIAAGGLFAVLVGFYALTFSFRAITDTDLNSLQTRSFVLHGDVDLARYERIHATEGQYAQRGGHLYSSYGVGITLVAAPVYLPLIHLGASDHFLQGAVGILYAAAAAVVFHRVLARLFAPSLAAAGTIVLAFGTTMWTVASMAFFQQGPVVFFECVGLAGLFSRRRGGPALAGVGFGMATLVRPTIVIPLTLLGFMYVLVERRDAFRYAIGAALPIAAVIVQNRWLWGGWLTGGYSHQPIGWHGSIPTGLFGLLFGWWRGLFVYSPALILAFLGLWIALRRRRDFVERRLVALGASAVATIIVYSKWTAWWGGLNQFGYRLLLEIVPFLIVLGVYAVSKVPSMRAPAFGLGAASVLIMTWGAAPSRGGFDGLLLAKRLVDTSLGQSWIVFANRPIQGLARLAGVVAVSGVIVVVSSHLAASGHEGTPEVLRTAT